MHKQIKFNKIKHREHRQNEETWVINVLSRGISIGKLNCVNVRNKDEIME